MTRVRSAVLLLALGAMIGTAHAAPKPFDTVADLLASARSGKTKEGQRVLLKRARLTTEPVANGYDGANAYQTWFYVNDSGRDGDGVLLSLANYYGGTNPFDDADDNPYENDITIPELHRGYEISITGILSRRSDASGGWMLERTEDDLSFRSKGSGDNKVEIIEHGDLKVLGKTKAPAPPAPTNVSVQPREGLRPGDRLVVTGRNLGDRAKVLWDGKSIEISERRPGLLVGRVPAGATPCYHSVSVSNPESGASAAITVKVAPAPTPPAPVITAATREGNVLVIRGSGFGSARPEVRMDGKLLTDLVDHSSDLLVLTAPTGGAGKVVVTVAGRESNVFTAKSVGITGAIPGF